MHPPDAFDFQSRVFDFEMPSLLRGGQVDEGMRDAGLIGKPHENETPTKVYM